MNSKINSVSRIHEILLNIAGASPQTSVLDVWAQTFEVNETDGIKKAALVSEKLVLLLNELQLAENEIAKSFSEAAYSRLIANLNNAFSPMLLSANWNSVHQYLSLIHILGNPHAVTLVEDIESANVAELGPQIESHASFPQRVNAGFMQVVNAHEIKLRVYERGSGETLSCGTGACAAVVSGIQLGLLQSPVLVHTRGGKLNIEWQDEVQPVLMTGPAEIVFEGEIQI